MTLELEQERCNDLPQIRGLDLAQPCGIVVQEKTREICGQQEGQADRP